MKKVLNNWREALGWTGHSHDAGAGKGVLATVHPSKLATRVALLLLAAAAVATTVGLVQLWPDYDRAAEVSSRIDLTAPGVTFERAEIIHIADGCGEEAAARGVDTGAGVGGGGGEAAPCLLVSAGLLTGEDEGRVVEIPVRGSYAAAGLQVGDRIELMAAPVTQLPVGSEAPGSEAPGSEAVGSESEASEAEGSETDAGGSPGTRYEITRTYDVSGVFRGLPLALLTLFFIGVVVTVGRIRGLLALVGLGISAGVIFLFVLPSLVTGGSGIAIAAVGSSAIMFVTLYLVHGPNLRTTAALIGTLVGIGIMALVSIVAIGATRLSGINDDAAGLLSSLVTGVDFRGLLSGAIIIAGLGILNDVTITQASAVWELRAAAPELSRREIYARAMRIGRDHIASTVYTVFFAYVGAALSVLILLYLYDRSALSLLTQDDIVVEIVRTLCGSIGLVLAVPITTGVATLFVPPEQERGESAEIAGAASRPVGEPR